MVKIDISEQEIQALDALMKDCKVPPEMGWVLTNLKQKILLEFKREFESKQKELARKMIDDAKNDEKN